MEDAVFCGGMGLLEELSGKEGNGPVGFEVAAVPAISDLLKKDVLAWLNLSNYLLECIITLILPALVEALPSGWLLYTFVYY
jgi:hypothetical protein